MQENNHSFKTVRREYRSGVQLRGTIIFGVFSPFHKPTGLPKPINGMGTINPGSWKGLRLPKGQSKTKRYPLSLCV